MATTITGSGVLVIAKGGKVLLLRRSGGGVEGWDLPKGGVEPGEDPLAAARRELHEEAGLTLSGTPREYVDIHRKSGRITRLYLTTDFLDTDPSEIKVRLSFEHDKYKWVPLELTAVKAPRFAKAFNWLLTKEWYLR